MMQPKQAGVRFVHVPYRGGGPAMHDAIAGHVYLLFLTNQRPYCVLKRNSNRAVIGSASGSVWTVGRGK